MSKQTSPAYRIGTTLQIHHPSLKTPCPAEVVYVGFPSNGDDGRTYRMYKVAFAGGRYGYFGAADL